MSRPKLENIKDYKKYWGEMWDWYFKSIDIEKGAELFIKKNKCNKTTKIARDAFVAGAKYYHENTANVKN